MRRFFTVALVGALALGAGSLAWANFCAFDPTPASSLLFPFVAFDYNNPVNGTTTLMAITNTSSEAQIVHCILFTDYSSPVLDWNILLSGYDVQTMNIRDILYLGDLPNTGTAGPNGPVPYTDGPVGYPSLPDAAGTQTLNSRCPSSDPSANGYPDYDFIPAGLLDLLQAWLTASQTATQYHDPQCWEITPGNLPGELIAGFLEPDDWFQARNTADVTWMYLTADVVWLCNKDFPDSEPLYWVTNTADAYSNGRPEEAAFANASGRKTFRNVLIGDVFWVDNSANFSEADNAVHLESDVWNDNVVTITPDLYPMSFYARYAEEVFGRQDRREPLPTAWGFRYLGYNTPTVDTWIRAFKQATNVSANPFGQNRVWDLWVGRITGNPDIPNLVGGDYDVPYTPSSMIAWDCLAYTYFAWDEDEEVVTSSGLGWSFPGFTSYNPNLLPLETQEVSVDQFNMPGENGWVMFLWPASNWTSGLAAWTESDWYQTWMGVKYGAYGVYTAGLSGAVLGNFNCFADQVWQNNLGVGYFYVDPLDGYKTSTNVY